MPTWITSAVVLHVAAGVLWLVASLALVVTRRAVSWLLALQLSAALTAVLAGIHLWHARHAGLQGPSEHVLTIGTFCALIALGLQAPIAVLALMRRGAAELRAGHFAVSCLGAGMLGIAAVAMVASRYA